MSAIFTLLRNFLGGFFLSVLAKLGTKKAVGIASIAAYIALTLGFIVAIKQTINIIFSLSAVPAFIEPSLGMIIPDNFAQVTAAIISAMIARAAYDLGVQKINLLNSAS